MSGKIFEDLTGKKVPATVSEANATVEAATGVKLKIRRVPLPGERLTDVDADAEVEKYLKR